MPQPDITEECLLDKVCIATVDGRAYYTISSRLRRVGMGFLSALPAQVNPVVCQVIITTKKEAGSFRGNVLAIEDLDEDPIVMKGQVLSRLINNGDRELLLGIDPGSRIGLAAFYAGRELASQTFNSRSALCKVVFELVNKVPNSRSTIKIGNGEPTMSLWLASRLRENLSDSVIEIVDEAGTSARNTKYRGLTKDQSAAARIAFRKGKPRLETG